MSSREQLRARLRDLRDQGVPTMLDMYCGAGGAAYGYACAGWYVVGVDHVRQWNYPYPYYMTDALEFLEWIGDEFDAYHASPPCQLYSAMGRFFLAEFRAERHSDMVAVTRDKLMQVAPDKPYVIENVVGAPLVDPIMLCGMMFDVPSYRHRLFESNVPLKAPWHPYHEARSADIGKPAKPGEYYNWIGSVPNFAEAKLHYDVWWMRSREIAQCVPPVYTQFIGTQLMTLWRANAALARGTLLAV